MRSGFTLLGLAGMAGAPWMFINFIEIGIDQRFNAGISGAIYGSLFIIGWLCSMIALYRIHLQAKPWVRYLILLQIIFLSLAELFNVYEVFMKDYNALAFILDSGWPLSGICMLFTSLAIFKAGMLTGWRKYMPLLAGLWFPITILALSGLLETSLLLFTISGIWSTVTFSLLGMAIFTWDHEKERTWKGNYIGLRKQP